MPFLFSRRLAMASLLSRCRPDCPVFAFTTSTSVRRRLNLQWGLIPFRLSFSDDMESNLNHTFSLLKARGMIQSGDLVIALSDMLQSIQVMNVPWERAIHLRVTWSSMRWSDAMEHVLSVPWTWRRTVPCTEIVHLSHVLYARQHQRTVAIICGFLPVVKLLCYYLGFSLTLGSLFNVEAWVSLWAVMGLSIALC